MAMLDFLKEHGGWIATIIAAIIAGVFGLFKMSGKKNSQTIKDVKDSNIQQANGSIKITIDSRVGNKEV